MSERRFKRPFWLVWLSTVISGLGDGITFVALPLLAASVTREPFLVSLVTVAAKVPWLVVSPITGVVTDRIDPRRLLFRIVTFQTVVMGLFASLVGLDATSIPLLVVVAFVMASAETLSSNASATVLPDLVSRRDLPTANSLVQGGQFVTSDFVGLAVGALLFATAEVLPFTVDAVTFTIAALLLFGLARGARPGTKDPVTLTSLRSEIAEGVRWLLRHRLLRALCGLIALSNFAVVGVTSIAVLYALEVLGISETAYGVLMMVIAVGGVVGVLTAPVLCTRLGLGRALQVSFVVAPAPFFVAAFTTEPVVAAAAFLFVGYSVSLGNVASMTLRQTLVPRHLFGRVNSSFRLVAVGLGPFAGGFTGLVAELTDLRMPFAIAGVFTLVAALVSLIVLNNTAVGAAAEAADRTDAAEQPDVV